MKIQNILTLKFTAIISVVLMVFCTVVLFFSHRFIEREFYERLETRALITATVYLEADEISEARLEKYKQRYLQTLSGEVIQVFNMGREQVFFDTEDNFQPDARLFQTIVKNESYHFREGDRQFAGIFYEDNQGDFVIIASAVDIAGIQNFENLIFILIFTFIVSVILTYFGGRVFSRQAMRPIQDVVKQVGNINANNLFLRVEEGNGKDEISELAHTFNQMLDRLEAAFDMQKTFISNASHEMRTPITGISGEIEFALMKERSAEEYKSTLISVQEEIDKFSHLIESILNLAKASFDVSKILFKKERLDELVMKAKESLSKALPNRKVNIKYENIESEDVIEIMANEQLLVIAIKNIIENALKFSKNEDRVDISISSSLNHVTLTVTDYGLGINEKDLKKVFVTFYRADNIRNISGHGVGLSITQKIIELHQGKIDIDSHPGKGTIVTMVFPLPKHASVV
jgi:signal transduction histidine kinase